MRLTAGGIRELHWHDAAEWALMLSGNARITAIDNAGKSYVKDVTVNDLWYFPTGTPHSIQGLDPDGCEFLLVFDDGKFSEGNTTLISDWTRHTPREALAKNWGVPEQGEPLPGPFTLRVGKEHATRVSNATPSNQPRNVADDSGEEGRHRACLKRNARKLFVAVRQGKAQLPAGCVALPVTGLVPPSRQFRFSKDCSRLAKVLVQTQPKTGLSILQG